MASSLWACKVSLAYFWRSSIFFLRTSASSICGQQKHRTTWQGPPTPIGTWAEGSPGDCLPQCSLTQTPTVISRSPDSLPWKVLNKRLHAWVSSKTGISAPCGFSPFHEPSDKHPRVRAQSCPNAWANTGKPSTVLHRACCVSASPRAPSILPPVAMARARER